MVDPSAVNYIKQQLHAGYTEEEVKEALLQAGWNEQDIKDAFFVIYGETKPIKPKAFPEDRGYIYGGEDEEEEKQEIPRIGFYGEKPKEPPEQIQEQKPQEQKPPEQKEPEKPEEKKEQGVEQKKPQEQQKLQEQKPPEQQGQTTGGFRIGFALAMAGGAIILANFVMANFLETDLLVMIYGELVLLTFLTPDIIQMIVLAAGIGSLVMGILLFLKQSFDLYLGLVVSVLGLAVMLCGNGYIIGGIPCIIGGVLAIVRK